MGKEVAQIANSEIRRLVYLFIQEPLVCERTLLASSKTPECDMLDSSNHCSMKLFGLARRFMAWLQNLESEEGMLTDVIQGEESWCSSWDDKIH